MKQSLPILELLKKPAHMPVFALVFGGLFYVNYYVMANLPGEQDLMCVMGGGLTKGNITFAVLMSLLAGFVVIGVIDNIKNRSNKGRVKVGGASLVGLVLGALTTFCTLCTIPVISLFGLSIGLSVFTDYEIYFKVASLVLLGVAFYFVNQEVKEGCARCVV